MKKDHPLIHCEKDITDEIHFIERRKIISAMALGSAINLFSSFASAKANNSCERDEQNLKHAKEVLGEKLQPNTFNEITRYNNYYEFSTNKEAIHILAQSLTTRPWTITIDGEVRKKKTIDIEQLLKKFPKEERIYPMRCVEGWSMVIPWQGFSLCRLLEWIKPNNGARYVQFTSLLRPEEMIGQRRDTISWPFTEALRIDEAFHPLTFLATGLYGKPMPNQNGAPLRLVVPWKYGFKSIKAITNIRLLKEKPATSWNTTAPSEYGFFANVNPAIAHPRWSQKRENRIGELRKIATLPFNGYAEQVVHLYKGMDLSVNY